MTKILNLQMSTINSQTHYSASLFFHFSQIVFSPISKDIQKIKYALFSIVNGVFKSLYIFQFTPFN